MNYGVPYKGSKNALAERIVATLPPAPVLVDLFAGGCAVTHAALVSRKFGRVIANDIDGRGIELFKNAIAGEYRHETRWIDRETFKSEKDRDPYVSLCWSFGNNGTNYLYSREIEPWKRALHYARVLGDFSLLREMGIDGDGSYADVLKHHDEYKRAYIRWYLREEAMPEAELTRLLGEAAAKVAETSDELREYLRVALRESGLTQAEVQRRLGTQMAGHYFGRSQWEFPARDMYDKMREFMPLKPYDEVHGVRQLWEELDALQRLQRLQSLQSLETSALDYAEVAIPPGAVVYADIPYQGTDGYFCEFDHARFWAWAAECRAPVYLSSYHAPPGWEVVAEWKHTSKYSSGASLVVERLFVQRHQLDGCGVPEQLELFA